jgi:glucan biosynthesis protein C
MASQITSGAGERLHALDAVRGGALLLGIAVHSSMSFWPVPFWPIRDNDPSSELLAGFIVLHIFRMSLFFVLAGFFARLLFKRRGAVGFIKNRAQRIAVPFVVGWPLLFAAFIAVIIWWAVKSSGGDALQPPQNQPGLSLQTLPLLHTWFLYVLLWLYAGTLLVVGALNVVDRKGRLGAAADAVMRFIVRFQLAPIVAGAPLAAYFFFKESWIMYGGVHTPDAGLLPNLQAMVAFASAFGFGWLLHRQMDLLSVWKRWWPLHLTLAVVLSGVCVVYSGLAADPAAVADMSLAHRLGASVVYPLAVWTWTFGLIGLATAFLHQRNTAIRYLADSSYWLYLIHLPVVMVFQVLFANVELAWFVKFPIMLALSFVLMIASYQLLVRNTFIGAVLNGRRYPGASRKAAPRTAETPAETPQLSAAQ